VDLVGGDADLGIVVVGATAVAALVEFNESGTLVRVGFAVGDHACSDLDDQRPIWLPNDLYHEAIARTRPEECY